MALKSNHVTREDGKKTISITYITQVCAIESQSGLLSIVYTQNTVFIVYYFILHTKLCKFCLRMSTTVRNN